MSDNPVTVNNVIQHAAIDAARVALQERESPKYQMVRKQSDNSPLTTADPMAERAIAETIRGSRLPDFIKDAYILGEEGTQHSEMSETGYRWVIDPIDGTGNFANTDATHIHQRRWAVSIALQRETPKGYKTVNAGILVVHPFSNSERVNGNYYTVEDGRVLMKNVHNGTVKHSTEHTKDAMYQPLYHASGIYLDDFPDHAYSGNVDVMQGDMRKKIAAIQHASESHRIRPVTCACADMMDVLTGDNASYAHGVHKPWDTAAAHFILEKAGVPVKEMELPGNQSVLFAAQDRNLLDKMTREYKKSSPLFATPRDKAEVRDARSTRNGIDGPSAASGN